MLDSTFLDRVSRLTSVRLADRRQDFPAEITKIAADMNARGVLHSSVHVQLSKVAHTRELDVRALIVWESIVHVHRTIGAPADSTLRDDFKSLLQTQIQEAYTELNGTYVQTAKRFGGQRDQSDLGDTLPRAQAKIELEVDLYVDSLRPAAMDTMTAAPTYNFYGNVSSVQTGAHSIAHNVQNLGSEEKENLIAALVKVTEAITNGQSLPERQRSELAAMAHEAQLELNSSDPNNTKLFTIFNVLAGTVQALPAAQPAYQVLKAALLPMGVVLP